MAVAQAGRDLEVGEGLLRRWMRDMAEAPSRTFPGHGQQRAEQAEIAMLNKEFVRLRTERDILKKTAVYDLSPILYPAGTRDQRRLSRRSAGEAMAGIRPGCCWPSPVANAAGVA